jgi:diadenosine tetraphosphatase ApaH/serine/threonine PP2A family protein phosphatase
LNAMMNLTEIVRRALDADSKEYINLIEESTQLLASEKGQIESLSIEGRLVKMKPSGEAVIVGDLHGDLESLVYIAKTSGFMEKAAQGKEVFLVFLGDYGDRGPFSPEVYYVVLKLKQLYPQRVVLMRGNHEGPDDLLASPHDLPENLRERFGEEEGPVVYFKIRELFRTLYVAVIVKELCVMIHGGVPSQASSLDDLKYAHLKHPKEEHLEEMLWSDPNETIRGTVPSPRGAGRLYGEDVTQKLLNMLNVKMLIRGHEPAQEGFKINHHGKVLTLFSRKGSPYFNSSAAYLQLHLSSNPKNTNELLPYILKF